MTRTLLVALALSGALVGQALGQGGDFIAPGSTPEGDYLRGGGVFLRGAGIYNYYTAAGNSINADTMIRVNEYIYQSIKHENAEQARHRAEARSRRLARYNTIRDRVENDPNQNDVLKGDALNALFGQLVGPRFHPSSYRANSFQLDADVVQKIPFFHGPHQATIAMSRISPAGKWPIALRGAEFARERRNYERALDAVLEMQLDRKTSRESLAVLNTALRDLFERLDQVIPPEKDTLYLEAKNYLRRLDVSREMMKKKDIEMIIGEIDRYSGTTVHDLMVFMQKYNLRFAIPEIGDERAAYPKLYAAMRQQLDELNDALKGDGRSDRDRKEGNAGGPG